MPVTSTRTYFYPVHFFDLLVSNVAMELTTQRKEIVPILLATRVDLIHHRAILNLPSHGRPFGGVQRRAECCAARSAKEAQMVRIWSWSSPRRGAASTHVVAEMTRPPGSFQDASRRDYSCLIRMCDARIVCTPAATDAIIPFPRRSLPSSATRRFGCFGCLATFSRAHGK